MKRYDIEGGGQLLFIRPPTLLNFSCLFTLLKTCKAKNNTFHPCHIVQLSNYIKLVLALRKLLIRLNEAIFLATCNITPLKHKSRTIAQVTSFFATFLVVRNFVAFRLAERKQYAFIFQTAARSVR